MTNANSKFFQQKVTLSRATRADANSLSILSEARRCLFMSAKKADFQCALAIWCLRFVIASLMCPA